MSQHDPVSAAWRAHRAYLVDLAFRMVGDIGVAEDMVQEAFSRLLRAPVGDIDDERGWLIVVTSRLCLDHIKSASTRRERPQDIAAWHDGDASVSSVDPADRVTLDDEVRLALLIMLERLGPAERVVFVLHEIFGLDSSGAGWSGQPDPRPRRQRLCGRRSRRRHPDPAPRAGCPGLRWSRLR